MRVEDAYAVLGLPRRADEDEVKRAYRKLALQHHPNKNPGDATATATFQRIQDAYTRIQAHRSDVGLPPPSIIQTSII